MTLTTSSPESRTTKAVKKEAAPLAPAPTASHIDDEPSRTAVVNQSNSTSAAACMQLDGQPAATASSPPAILVKVRTVRTAAVMWPALEAILKAPGVRCLTSHRKFSTNGTPFLSSVSINY